jgi:hypothetical protein
MSLSEFLLAMFDADEARRWYVHDAECDVWAESSGLLLAQVFVDMTISVRCSCPVPARVLAECEAKRRIVAWCSERERIDVSEYGDGGDAARESHFLPGGLIHKADSVVLRYLALPYADHPDYREQWRP